MIKAICVAICLGVFIVTNGQVSLNTAGRSASASNGSIDFSIGETFGNYSSGSTGSVKAGVIQPFILSIPTSVVNPLDPTIRVFPNPVLLDDLKIENPRYQHSTLVIADLQGRIVLQRTIDTGSSGVDLSQLTKGTYVIRIYSMKNVLLYSSKLLKL